ncbi:unnamed protein product, partial [Rotaria sordida]
RIKVENKFFSYQTLLTLYVQAFNSLTIQYMNFITNKAEEKTGMDLNQDGRVGGSGVGGGRAGGGGIIGQAEKATNMDLNRDGVVGGQKAAGGGGLLGKAEQMTNMDLNRDGRIGGGATHQKH